MGSQCTTDVLILPVVCKDTNFLYLRKIMPEISENSTRIARNTILLYFRMLLLMCIGLFTSRVVLNSLGVDDFGIYGAVGGVVMLFTVVTNSVSQSISRYITWHLGLGQTASKRAFSQVPNPSGDSLPQAGKDDNLHRVFSTAVLMQLIFCALLLILTETAGLWWVNNKMSIPADRYSAANWVLQCSMGVLMVNLVSVPFNATIISHERMDVFAWISIGEAVLKLAVALLIFFSPVDKLKLYAVLLLAVALLVRFTYGAVCRRLFDETRGRVVFDMKLLKEMTSFASWNVLGSSTYVVNTQGVTQLVNVFFGVAVNAARSVAFQVENIIKQFVNNLLTAINPQITKSLASSNKAYCFELVGKGVKYSGLILLALGIPLVLEAPELLRLWLKNVPAGSVVFTRLTLICVFAETLFSTLLVLIQADGRIKGYYLVTSAIALLCFALSWAAFAAGFPAYVSYILYALVFLLIDVVRLIYARRLTGLPVWPFAKESLLPVICVGVLGSILPVAAHFLLPQGGLRLLVVLLAELISLPALCWFLAFTPGERSYLSSKVLKRS